MYAPRDSAAPMRLSRRSNYARQALVRDVAVDPTTQTTLYTVEPIFVFNGSEPFMRCLLALARRDRSLLMIRNC